MRRATKAFYLACFSLFAGTYAQAHHSRDTCAIDPKAIISDACVSYDTLDTLSTTLNVFLKDVTENSDFFSFYRLNLYSRECPYWDDSTASCGNVACAVNTVDEEHIPEIWRRSELSKLEGPKAKHPDKQKQKERPNQKPLQGSLGDDVDESCVVEYDDECDERDYCIPEDAGSPGKGDYVSLLDNRERFTGYAGDHAHAVWDSIYRENCFTKPSPPNPVMSNPFAPMAKGGLAKGGIGGSSIPEVPFIPDDSCMEKRVFYRIISGMHASISTHICHEYLNRTTGVWSPNLNCYIERLHSHPDRISNLYFNYALVSRAVAKLLPYLDAYTFCAGDPAEDKMTKIKVVSLAQTAASAPGFDEMLMFRDPGMAELKHDFRTRFRNVSRIMDCVGCDKCRLWGKLQTNGYGTALKVLFEFNGDEAPAYDSRPLKRTELVALVNTLARLGNSMQALKEFREMMHTEDVASQLPSSGAATLEQDEVTTKNQTATIPTDDLGVKFESMQQRGPVAGRGSGFASAHEIKEKPTNDEDDAAIESDDDDDETIEQESTWDVSMRELRLVYYTCVWILKQWWAMPGRLLNILLYQLNRLWAYWLGLYVPPPMEWRWNRPDFNRDEL